MYKTSLNIWRDKRLTLKLLVLDKKLTIFFLKDVHLFYQHHLHLITMETSTYLQMIKKIIYYRNTHHEKTSHSVWLDQGKQSDGSAVLL